MQVEKQALKALYNGKFLDIKQTNLKKFDDEKFALFCDDVFIGVYKANSQTQAKPEFVLTKV